MVVVFFGTPQFAVPTLRAILASRHRVCGVVTQPDRPRGRGQKVTDGPVKALALEHGLPVIQPDNLRDPAAAAMLRTWNPDIGVVAAYGRLIPESLLQVPRHGMINVHASLLPKYRGAAPVHRAVIDGATDTGVTIMRVARLLDSGDTFASVTRPIAADETSETVEHDLGEMGARLLVEVLDRIEAGTASEEPQDHGAATYASKISRDDGRIDWSLPASAIHNLVRGLYPWPHAYTWLDGSRIIVHRTHVAPGTVTAVPGTVVTADGDTLHVATGDGGVLAIDVLQPEGRRAMPARDYLAGRPIAVGARFGTP